MKPRQRVIYLLLTRKLGKLQPAEAAELAKVHISDLHAAERLWWLCLAGLGLVGSLLGSLLSAAP